MRLRNTFENLLTLEDVQALAPDLLAAVLTPCPADTMFGNEIRMGGFRALTKYHFKEGIAAGVLFAKTQGGHGSESRTGVIMKEIMSYGSAAREALPGLRELIVQLNEQCQKGEFPAASSIIGESPPSKRPSRPSKPPPISPSCEAWPTRRPRRPTSSSPTLKQSQAIALTVNAGETAPARQRPNISFLMDDQHRWDAIGRIDPAVKTPTLDRLA